MNELHRCHRAGRCTNREKDADNPAILRGAAINPAEGFCDTCERHIRRAIAELPRDYLDLETSLAGRRGALGQLVAGTRELPIPICAAIEAAQAETLHEAQCWAESTAEIIGVYWDTQKARHSRPGRVLERSKRILTGGMSAFLALRGAVHFGWSDGEWIALERSGLDGAVVLLGLHDRARSLTGQTRLVNRPQTPCPRCEHAALEHENGSDTITCRACGRPYTLDQYEKLCGLFADRKELVA